MLSSSLSTFISHVRAKYIKQKIIEMLCMSFAANVCAFAANA